MIAFREYLAALFGEQGSITEGGEQGSVVFVPWMEMP